MRRIMPSIFYAVFFLSLILTSCDLSKPISNTMITSTSSPLNPKTGELTDSYSANSQEITNTVENNNPIMSTPPYGLYNILPRQDISITSDNVDQIVELAYINYRPPVLWLPIDNTLIASPSGSSFDLLDLSSSVIKKRSITVSPFGLRFSPNEKYFASTFFEEDNFGIYNFSDGSAIGIISSDLQSPGYTAITTAFSPDSEILATVFGDMQIKLWHLPDLSLIRTISCECFIYSVVFSPDGKSLVTGGLDGVVTIFNLSDETQFQLQNNLENISMSLANVAFSKDGKYIAAAGLEDNGSNFSGLVRVWNVADRNEIYYLLFDNWVSGIAFSPNNEVLAVNANDLYILNAIDGKILSQFRPIPDDTSGLGVNSDTIAFSPDGSMLASASQAGNFVYIWGLPK
ncbi:MAG: hypothetical protein NTZ74_05165 [Chloroflexi bacterium]|nr:hypothetical protein [Chloroflexota bacterium]